MGIYGHCCSFNIYVAGEDSEWGMESGFQFIFFHKSEELLLKILLFIQVFCAKDKCWAINCS